MEEGNTGRITHVAFIKYEHNVSTGQSLELEGNLAKRPSEVDQRSPVYEELRAQTPRFLGGCGSAEDPILLALGLFPGRLQE